jgi:cell wall-associated NlpC family hydrolase
MIDNDFPAWAASVIGAKYERGGRGPDAFDCWGLVWHYFKTVTGEEMMPHMAIDVKQFAVVARNIEKAANSSDWVKLKQPEHGAVVAMSKNRVLHHVGIWLDIDGGKCFHAYDGCTVIAHNLQQLRNQHFRKIEFYRYANLKQSNKPGECPRRIRKNC